MEKSIMNLPGPYQRREWDSQGRNGGASLAVVFRSRPSFVNATQRQQRAVPGDEERGHPRGQWLRNTPAWHASVCDEVRACANGALLRRITILITDGPQLEAGEAA
jgi:hypothetical protein